MRYPINLSIAGLGIIFYSPFAVTHIQEGDDYLKRSFWEPEDVARHVNQCHIAALGTGSPGDFRLILYDGNLKNTAVEEAEFKARLGLEVREQTVCFRDLYDLMDWSPHCPTEHQAAFPDGFYLITAYCSRPRSGIFGDHQTIYLHFDHVSQRPKLAWKGIPHLCPVD